MSAHKRSVSMPEEMYEYVIDRSRKCGFTDKGSKFIQELIRADMRQKIVPSLSAENGKRFQQSKRNARSAPPKRS